MVHHSLISDVDIWMTDWPSHITIDQEDIWDFYIRELDHFILCPRIKDAEYGTRALMARQWLIGYLRDTHPEVTSLSFVFSEDDV